MSKEKHAAFVRGMSVEAYPWDSVRLSSVGLGDDMVRLEPGHVVTEIADIGDFTDLERRICAQLAEGYRGEVVGTVIEKDRLANEMRPEHFNGRVENGYAFVFPFDFFRHLSKERKGRLNYLAGFTLLLTADLHSSSPRMPVAISREVSYYRTGADKGQLGGPVRRLLGDRQSIDRASLAVQEGAEAPAQTARALRILALWRHAASGGAPTLGGRT